MHGYTLIMYIKVYRQNYVKHCIFYTITITDNVTPTTLNIFIDGLNVPMVENIKSDD